MPGGVKTRSQDTDARARGRLGDFRRDRRGGVSIVFCVGLIALAVIACGAIEMTELFTERNEMRGVSDSAALWGAAALTLTGEDGVEERTRAYAESQLTKLARRTNLTVETAIVDLSKEGEDRKAGLKVTIRGHRASFFGGLFPPGGFKVSVSSTALSVSKMPMCVLAIANTSGLVEGLIEPLLKESVALQAESQIKAPGCLIQSNEDVKVDARARIEAGLVQAAGTARGPIDPAPRTGAKTIEDPFKDIAPPRLGNCSLLNLQTIKIEGGTTYLDPGLHCANYELGKDALLILRPGEHKFGQDFRAKDASRVTGTDVVLIFDNRSKFEFRDNSSVSLDGRQSGPLAGFVIYSEGTALKDFMIESNHVENLLGTIYLPYSQLVVTGKGGVARQSDWTVIVAKAVKLQGNPILYINSNYAGSPVPVPAGVGAKSMDTRIVR
jgi:putative Flp pilus-assembly TadE/G-like protein